MKLKKKDLKKIRKIVRQEISWEIDEAISIANERVLSELSTLEEKMEAEYFQIQKDIRKINETHVRFLDNTKKHIAVTQEMGGLLLKLLEKNSAENEEAGQ